MSSVFRPGGKRKKSRVLGEPNIVSGEAYVGLELDSKVGMIRALVPLGLMHVEELLDAEVRALAGERSTREKTNRSGGGGTGGNPGTVRLPGQRVPVRIPPVRSEAGVEIPLRYYDAFHGDGEVDELLLRRMLYEISCGNYESSRGDPGCAIGLSGSTVSRRFVEASAAKLRDGISRTRVRSEDWRESGVSNV